MFQLWLLKVVILFITAEGWAQTTVQTSTPCLIAESDLHSFQHLRNRLQKPGFRNYQAETTNEECRSNIQKLFDNVSKYQQLDREPFEGDLDGQEIAAMFQEANSSAQTVKGVVNQLQSQVSKDDFDKLRSFRLLEDYKYTENDVNISVEDNLRFWLVELYSDFLKRRSAGATESQQPNELFEINAEITNIMSEQLDESFHIVDISAGISNLLVRSEALLRIPDLDDGKDSVNIVKLFGAIETMKELIEPIMVVTKYRNNMISQRYAELETKAKPIFEEWLEDLNASSDKVHKALPLLSCPQMKAYGVKVNASSDPNELSNAIEMLASTNSYEKACAYMEVVSNPRFTTSVTIFVLENLSMSDYEIQNDYVDNLQETRNDWTNLVECYPLIVKIFKMDGKCIRAAGSTFALEDSQNNDESCRLSMLSSPNKLTVTFKQFNSAGNIGETLQIEGNSFWELSLREDKVFLKTDMLNEEMGGPLEVRCASV